MTGVVKLHEGHHKIAADAKLKNGSIFDRYTRMGECSRCGMCCMKEEEGDLPCRYLIFNDNKTTVCSVHGTDLQPDHCKIYPCSPPIMFKSCGYYFKDSVTGKTLRWKET